MHEPGHPPRAATAVSLRAVHLGLATALVALTSGALIYLAWRSRSLLAFDIVDAVGAGGAVTALRAAAAGVDPPGWVCFALPDGLWTFAWVIAALSVWRGRVTPWVALVPGVAVTSELLQAAHLLRGTFDVLDLVAYVTGALAGFAAGNAVLHGGSIGDRPPPTSSARVLAALVRVLPRPRRR
jgi:hypothetical protein